MCPTDFSREVPATAWKWLFQYGGLTYSYWKDKVGYSPSEERLVFTIGEPILFSWGRYVGKEEGHRKWYVWGNPEKHCTPISPGLGTAIILVEDIVSAHVVGQVTECIPLFGVNVNPSTIYYLRQQGKPVFIWQDKDQESAVYKRAIRLQTLINAPVGIIVTVKDPKEQSYETIRSTTQVMGNS